jgi:hypothetical protein
MVPMILNDFSHHSVSITEYMTFEVTGSRIGVFEIRFQCEKLAHLKSVFQGSQHGLTDSRPNGERSKADR